MKLRTIVALALVATLLVPGVAVAAVLGSPDLSASLADNRVSPGESTALEIVVTNTGDLESGSAQNPSLNAEVTQARGLTLDMSSGDAPVSVRTGERAVGTLPEGASQPQPFQIVVDEDAEPGTYDVPIRAEYEYTSYISEGGDGNRDRESAFENLEVRLRVVDEANFEVVDVDNDVRVGGDGDLNVTVQNTGTEAATDVTAAVESTNADVTFGGAQQASRHVGAWEAGENRTLTYGVTATDAADPVEYDLDMTVSFDDADGVQRQDAGNTFGVRPAPEQSFSLGDVSSDLAVADDGTLEVDLVNEGEQAVEDVVLQWTGEHETLTVTEREYAVGELGAGESATASFDVEVGDSARSGPRQFAFQATYSDDDGDQRTSDELTVRESVGPKADAFDVDVTDARVTAGGTSQLNVTITNAEDERVTDVSTKLFADSPVSTSDDEAFVSGLDPGESATIVFGVGAGGGALEKTYPVSLDFRYDEADGDTELSDTYRLPVEVVEPDDDGGLPLLPIAVVALLIVLAVGGYYRYR